MSTSEKKSREEIKALRKERKLAKKAERKLKAANQQSKQRPKQKGRGKNKNGGKRGRPRDPIARGFSSVRRVDVAEARAFAAHLVFPEWVPAARIPDASPTASALSVNKWEASPPVVTDGKVASNAYWGIAMNTGMTGQYYYLSAVGTATAGVFTWSPVDNPKVASLSSMTALVRQIGMRAQVRNIASLSVQQGRWLVGRTNPTMVTTSGSTTTLPVSIDTVTGLRSNRECPANDPGADGICVSHIPLSPGATSTLSYAAPSVATGVLSGFTYIIWAGSSTAAIAPSIYVDFVTTYEYLPYQDSEYLVSTSSWIGSLELVGQAMEVALKMWSAAGCTGKERREFFKRTFGMDAPKSEMDVGDTATVGVALSGADELRARTRALLLLLPQAKLMVESGALDEVFTRVFEELGKLDLSDPVVEQKTLLSRNEVEQMVRNMLDSSRSEREEKDSVVSVPETRVWLQNDSAGYALVSACNPAPRSTSLPRPR